MPGSYCVCIQVKKCKEELEGVCNCKEELTRRKRPSDAVLEGQLREPVPISEK